MSYKIVYDGEWVKVRNMMNKWFSASRPCSVCREFKVKSVWYSVKTKEVRCLKCFTPKQYL